MVATAVKLASKRRRGIHVHSMMTVPTNLPLDAELPDAEAEAQRRVEEAKLIGGAAGHRPRRPRAARPGGLLRSPRRRTEIKAAAMVVGLRYRNGVPQYDKTLQTVLGERPCRVIVVSEPSDKPVGVPAAALVEVGAMNRERVYHGAIRGFSLGLRRRRPAAPRRRPSSTAAARLDRLPDGDPLRRGRRRAAAGSRASSGR